MARARSCGWALRPAADAPPVQLFDTFAAVRSPAFRRLGWPEQAVDGLLRQQYAAREHYWCTRWPQRDDDAVWLGEEFAGRLCVAREPGVLRIVEIELDARFRGLGLGTALLRHLQVRARADGRDVVLQVDVGNTGARRLYERLGFTVEGGDELQVAMRSPVAAVTDTYIGEMQ